MKMSYVAGAVLFSVSLFLCQVYAVEICEPQDYYNLLDPKECRLEYEKAGHKIDPRDAMFEIMKNYPFEKKDRFINLLQRKVELVDTYIIQQKSLIQTEKVRANISKLERTKQDLLGQEGLVNASTPDTWVVIRDQARKLLDESAQRLREVE